MALSDTDSIFYWIDRVTGREFARAGGASTSVPTYRSNVINGFSLPVARFDGGDYLDLDGAHLSDMGGFTEISVFIVMHNVTDTGFGAFLARDASGDRGFNCFKDNGVGQGMRFYVPLNASTQRIQETTGNIDDGETHIITGIWDGGNSRQDVYFNGILDNEQSPSVPATWGNLGPDEWRVGNDHFSDFLIGDIVEILVYDRVINETERALIQATLELKYAGIGSPGVDSGLCMWLRADDLGLAEGASVASWVTAAGGADFVESTNSPTFSLTEALPGPLPMVQFRRGNSNRMDSHDNYLQELTEMTVIITGRCQTITQAFNTWIASHSGAGSGNTNFYFRCYQAGGATMTFNWFSASGSTSIVSTTSMVVGEIYTWVFTVTAAGTGAIRLNGVQEVSGGPTIMPGSTGKASPQEIFLAVQGNLGTNTRGDLDMAEVLIYNRVLSGGELTTVEAYLDNRWANDAPPGGVVNGLIGWFEGDNPQGGKASLLGVPGGITSGLIGWFDGDNPQP